jgi:hypothetical protein
VTLPARGTEIETYDKLRNDKRIKIEELDVNDGVIQKIVELIRAGDDIHTKLDKDTLVKIFTDIFGVYDRPVDYVDDWHRLHYKNKRLIPDAVTWSPEWATTRWSSTFEHMDRWFHSQIQSENYYHKGISEEKQYLTGCTP